jgi:hypothetical protein
MLYLYIDTQLRKENTMGAQAEKRIEQRHACRGTMEWDDLNKECYGATKALNFSSPS